MSIYNKKKSLNTKIGDRPSANFVRKRATQNTMRLEIAARTSNLHLHVTLYDVKYL